MLALEGIEITARLPRQRVKDVRSVIGTSRFPMRLPGPAEAVSLRLQAFGGAIGAALAMYWLVWLFELFYGSN